MEGRDGIFEDYMGCQYREGQIAFEQGLPLADNPYDGGEMSEAWAEGWNYACDMERLDRGKDFC